MKKVIFIGTSISFATVTTTFAGYCYNISKRPDDQKLHIVMDLDITLLQSYPKKSLYNVNHSNLRKHDHEIDNHLIWHRPFAHISLWFLNQLFVVHLFTAATKSYGEACIQSFPGMFENKRLFRDSTNAAKARNAMNDASASSDVAHGKDLSLIHHEMTRVVLVDDQARNRVGDQLFYHIPPYTRFNLFDFELPKLCVWAVHWQYKHDRNNRQ